MNPTARVSIKSRAIQGKVVTVDVGEFIGRDGRRDFFMHAAAIGLNVAVARIATQASFRKRLGRLTYAVAGVIALRQRRPFVCELHLEQERLQVRLLHLSVINAPVFGGFFGLQVAGSNVDDRRLDVVAVENMPLPRLLVAALLLAIGQARKIRGITTYHVKGLRVHSDAPLAVSLDGEVSAEVPGDFVLAAEALRVMAPLDFVDVDD